MNSIKIFSVLCLASIVCGKFVDMEKFGMKIPMKSDFSGIDEKKNRIYGTNTPNFGDCTNSQITDCFNCIVNGCMWNSDKGQCAPDKQSYTGVIADDYLVYGLQVDQFFVRGQECKKDKIYNTICEKQLPLNLLAKQEQKIGFVSGQNITQNQFCINSHIGNNLVEYKNFKLNVTHDPTEQAVFGMVYERHCDTSILNKPEECKVLKSQMGNNKTNNDYQSLVQSAHESFFLLETRDWHIAMIKTESGDTKLNPYSKVAVQLLGLTPQKRKNIDHTKKKFSDTFQEFSSLVLFILGFLGFVFCGYHDHLKKIDTEKVIKRLETKAAKF